ncbi:tagatose-6-phosphate ketose/aldose isomerase [Neobacillus bataviensis LMG 21833]|uniref:Tagatose-6-phosphate ketose/aldose isomerase n=1 Tax=Neobacillus bataviensis LMG 21833 TaxID=1117379 RepID=K6C280_9BACI|nr:SIS domain-containing protein [Neobacillus bataviensis]EKN65255.1 tagatose-6-phosphate ketose/aldose isomerase [Neobacillus bataviensis LMG 21833]
MFTLSPEKLMPLGAAITTAEIKQQPELWGEAFALYTGKSQKIESFLQNITEKHNRVRVIFTGAGTSAYVGDTITPYLKEKVDENQWDLMSVSTTAIVSNPYQFLKADIPTLLISFARSGNSPESVATVELAEQVVKDLYQITITCSKEGKLAQRAKGDDSNLLLLMPEKSNDQGFAMTGSYTCMALTALLIFDSLSVEEKSSIVANIRKMGQTVINKEAAIEQMIADGFERIIYLGSGGFEGLAREAQLKILELTAGKIATSFDSSLGFRHGPKSFVNEKTAIFVFVSNQPYTRQYDLDMLQELSQDQIASTICAISVVGETNFAGDTFSFDGSAARVPDAYLSLPYVMVGQTIALFASIKVGNTPDTPSPSGTVNRVVKGVTIHEYK